LSIFLEEGFIFNVSLLGGTVVTPGSNNLIVIMLLYTLQLKEKLKIPLCNFENRETFKLLGKGICFGDA
jgi:hypothetical protein